jgi:hypothetical protein
MMFIERYGLMVVFIIVLLGSSFIGPLMGGAIEFFLDVFKGIFRI